MAANNLTKILMASARVVSNGTTPPNGYIQGELITSITRTGAGVYNVQVSPDISLQEFVLDVGLLGGSAGGQIQASKVGAGHLQVNTWDGSGAAADSDFTLQISRVRVGT